MQSNDSSLPRVVYNVYIAINAICKQRSCGKLDLPVHGRYSSFSDLSSCVYEAAELVLVPYGCSCKPASFAGNCYYVEENCFK